jgi:hypothetical protein
MQAFPHFTSGAAHWMPHLPAEHTGVPPPVAGQTLPHWPQFLTSDARARHAVPQRESPALQRISHLPAAHAGRPPPAPGQALPQAAQFAGSLDVFTHAFPQLVVPPPQIRVHAPTLHTSPIPHDLPQPPQWDVFDAGATHTPLHAACPGGHVKLQRPSWHVDVPPAGPVQARLHAPQCPGVLARFTQREPHCVLPASHPAELAGLGGSAGGVVGTGSGASASGSPGTGVELDGTGVTLCV